MTKNTHNRARSGSARRSSFTPITTDFTSHMSAGLDAEDVIYGARRATTIADEAHRVLASSGYTDSGDRIESVKERAGIDAFTKYGPSFRPISVGLLRDYIDEFVEDFRGKGTPKQLAQMAGLINGILASTDYQESEDVDHAELASILAGFVAIMRGERVEAV